MAVCDICNRPGRGTLVRADDMRIAVFQRGFNPFALGLVDTRRADAAMQFLGIPVDQDSDYLNWRDNIVARDLSDWNICSRCMAQLRHYLSDSKAVSCHHGQTSSQQEPAFVQRYARRATTRVCNGVGSDIKLILLVGVAWSVVMSAILGLIHLVC